MGGPEIRIKESNGEEYILLNGIQKLQELIDTKGFTPHIEKGQKIYRAIIN